MGPAILDRPQSIEALAPQHNVLVPQEMEQLEAELDDYLRHAHEAYRVEARDIRDRNIHEALYGDEHVEALWRQNDAFGYQREYVQQERSGVSTEELSQLAQARIRNVRTGFLEALNAMDVDVPNEMLYDIDTNGRFNDSGMYLDDMYLKSLTAGNGDVELDRREVESANIRAWQDLADVPDIEKLAHVEFSLRNEEEGAIGYVEPIDKMQIRYMAYVDTPDGRKLSIQTAFINGLKYDTEFMNRFLRAIGHIEPNDTLDRTQMLARPRIVMREDFDGPVDIIRLMDAFYEQETGEDVIFGVSSDLRPDLSYATISERSKEDLPLVRQAIADIDAYMLNLVRRDIAYDVAERMLDDYQKYWALLICRQDPELARVVFDNRTYEELLKVQQLASISDEQAEEAFANAFAVAPSLMGCGATCRLEVASTAEKAKAYAKGMKEYKESGEMYVDKGARCPKCGHRGILRSGNGVLCLNPEQCGASRVNDKVDDGKAGKEETTAEQKSTYEAVKQEFENNQAHNLQDEVATINGNPEEEKILVKA